MCTGRRSACGAHDQPSAFASIHTRRSRKRVLPRARPLRRPRSACPFAPAVSTAAGRRPPAAAIATIHQDGNPRDHGRAWDVDCFFHLLLHYVRMGWVRRPQQRCRPGQVVWRKRAQNQPPCHIRKRRSLRSQWGPSRYLGPVCRLRDRPTSGKSSLKLCVCNKI